MGFKGSQSSNYAKGREVRKEEGGSSGATGYNLLAAEETRPVWVLKKVGMYNRK